MKKLLLACCLLLGLQLQAQTTPVLYDSTWFYIQDARGNRDSVFIGFTHDTLTDLSSWDSLGLAPFDDTLELRVLATDYYNYVNSWKRVVIQPTCSDINGQIIMAGLGFSTMYPPVTFSWSRRPFMDTCLMESVFTPNYDYTVHPYGGTNTPLIFRLVDQSSISISLNRDPRFVTDYPDRIYTNQTMRSGAIDTVFTVHLVLQKQPLETAITVSEQAKSLKLFPNPSHGLIRLAFEQEASKPWTYVVYDALGRTWKRAEHQDTQQVTQLDLQGLAQGTYFLWIERDGQTYRQSFQMN